MYAKETPIIIVTYRATNKIGLERINEKIEEKSYFLFSVFSASFSPKDVR